MSLVLAYRRLAALCPELGLDAAAPGSPPGPGRTAPGWVDGARLVDDAAARQSWLAAEAAEIRVCYAAEARDDVVASRALHGYLWSVCLLISGPWYLERRVPLLRPADVLLGPGGSVRVVPGPFACLPGDPAAGSGQARVLDCEEALGAELRRAVADHVRPLLGVLRPDLRRGTRALWGMVGDDLISGLWHLGRALGEEDHAADLATRLLPAPTPPFPGGARFRPLPDGHPGPERLTRTRIGCCMHYTIRPEETCSTCPRLRAATRAPVAAAPAGA
ncbi:(2Fe-2S)-binding protein [Streptomyces sp. NBC_01198]|uniref:(2Fe-2S)-binding protein n=1 Tax=Streptomyces sp. NBC_01198 TaxID=2903769 RepID=UPI002E0F0C20|nr:(2Fe-2S)-binding protein [Streptomyces sp. NBC_01198]